MRIIIITIAILLISSCTPSGSKWVFSFEEVAMQIEFPSKAWFLSIKDEKKPPWNTYKFELNSVEVPSGKAQVWVTIKDARDVRDVLDFLAKNRHANFDEIEYFFVNKSQLTNIDSSMGYKRKVNSSNEFDSYSVFAVRHGKGIILDFVNPTNSPVIERQMRKIMKSVIIN